MAMQTDSPQGPVRVVLDTSVFTNPDTARQWGETSAAAFALFLRTAERARARTAFYMPPSIYDELKNFIGDGPDLATFELVVRLQAPNRYNVLVPGFLLYEVIDEIRERINRGLRVAEKAVREVQQPDVEESISRLRQEYRGALRAGLVDSKEDVDLLLLAHELDAALVSSDGGVVKTAEKLGLRLIHPEHLRAILERLVENELPAQQRLQL
jgi:uncharacterized protein